MIYTNGSPTARNAPAPSRGTRKGPIIAVIVGGVLVAGLIAASNIPNFNNNAPLPW